MAFYDAAPIDWIGPGETDTVEVDGWPVAIANVDGAFYGWADSWLDPAFKTWNLEEFLPAIKVPTLVIQGESDEYGTLEQVERIRRQVSGPVECLILPHCGHSPHRDQRAATLAAMTEFIRKVL